MENFFYFIKESKNDENILCVLSDMINSYFFNYTPIFKNTKIIHKIFMDEDIDIVKNLNLLSVDISYLYNSIPLFKTNLDELIECIMNIKKNPQFLYNLKLQILYWNNKYNFKLSDLYKNIVINNDYVSLSIIKSQLKNKKLNIPKTLKINVWNKYIGDEIGKTKCPVCETNFITQSNFECAHIQAESNNGQTNIDNLIPCCSICNKSMKNMNLFEFKKKFFN